MKTTVWIIAMIALTISACTSSQKATTSVNDDVYDTSPSEVAARPASSQPATQGAQVITSPDNVKAQKPVSSFEEDYNDYSTRINRFNNNDTTVGYFDDSYASSSSEGGQGDNSPDINLSLGFGGYYGPSYSYGIGLGYPYSPWGWDYGWGYPYYGYNYGWGYPYYGYSPWYNPWYGPCCYYYDYYQPYYYADTYYGSRKPLSRTDGGGTTPETRNTSNNLSNSTQRNVITNPVPTERTTQTAQTTTVARTTQPAERTTSSTSEQYRYTRPTGQTQVTRQGATPANTVRTNSQATRQQPAPKYIRPENGNTVERSGTTQSYSSPVYRQPKSSQEYLAPRNQNPGTRSVNQNQNTTPGERGTVNTSTRQGTAPASSGRSYTAPTRSGSSGSSSPARSNFNTRTSKPSGTSGTYSAPARSGSSGTYSAPTRSGSSGSYSAPTRSSGSGGSAPSGSGGSGGGRRR